jgi:hypothetical protein
VDELGVRADAHRRGDARRSDAGAEVSSTLARGIETEIKWVPFRDLYLSVYGSGRTARYIVDTSANIEVNGRQIGSRTCSIR